MDVERRLDRLGLTLPAEAALPAGVEIPFAWVRVRGTRAYVSGHDALAADGSPAGPFGKIPSEATLEEAQHSAILAILKATLGDLDRVDAHRQNAWQSLSWPAEIDVFLVIGELALYVAYLDGWPGQPVTFADRLTAATSPLAAFAGLTIGLLVLKMTRQRTMPRTRPTITPVGLILASRLLAHQPAPSGHDRVAMLGAVHVFNVDRCENPLLADAGQILEGARAWGDQVSQRYLAAQLRGRGHRFSNAQLRDIAEAIGLTPEHRAARVPDTRHHRSRVTICN